MNYETPWRLLSLFVAKDTISKQNCGVREPECTVPGSRTLAGGLAISFAVSRTFGMGIFSVWNELYVRCAHAWRMSLHFDLSPYSKRRLSVCNCSMRGFHLRTSTRVCEHSLLKTPCTRKSKTGGSHSDLWCIAPALEIRGVANSARMLLWTHWAMTCFSCYYWTLYRYRGGYQLLYYWAMDPWMLFDVRLFFLIVYYFRIPNCSTTEQWTSFVEFQRPLYRYQPGYLLLCHWATDPLCWVSAAIF